MVSNIGLLFSFFLFGAQLVAPTLGFSNVSNNRHPISSAPKSVAGFTATAAATSDSNTETTSVVRNIFQDYDKPILLMGCSSQGQEIQRLAESFLSQYYPGKSVDEGILSASGDNDEAILSLGKDSSQPSIVVMDFSGIESESESKFIELAESAYSKTGLLSVYINVDPSDESAMSSADKVRKQRLEEDVFVNFSDYELCIQNEGTSAQQHWEHIEWELARLVARARLAPAIPGSHEPSTNTAHLSMGENTFFLSLSFPEIQQVEPYVEEMCVDVDARVLSTKVVP